MADRPTILIVDDDPDVLQALGMLFEDDYEVASANSGSASIELVKAHPEIAVVVMDIKMPGMDGISAGREIRELNPKLPLIFHTGYPGDFEEAEIDESERPFDYVEKGMSSVRLMRAVRNAVAINEDLCQWAADRHGILGRSKPMQETYRVIQKVFATDAKVMILGETGTGKELVAKAIHNSGSRRERPLAILNCNHKAPDMVESELFGHRRGAFTGAVADRIGLFEYADGGTVFLDEIGDLDITTQGKVLRVLETGEFQRIGAPESRTTNVRLLCATHRDLKQMVVKGTFREDLYYRLHGIQINLPPLRQRREDIPLLVDSFRNRFTVEKGLRPCLVDQSAMDRLVSFYWPGNVRQLHDTIESLMVLTDSGLILAADVEEMLEIEPTNSTIPDASLAVQMRDQERILVLKALQRSGYNISAAARLLGLDRTTLSKKIKALEIDLRALKNTPPTQSD